MTTVLARMVTGMQPAPWQPRTEPVIEQALLDWQPDLIGTLVFVVQDAHVLLIEKKTGHGAGLCNGPGGKLEPGETPEQCAHRELREELQVGVAELTPAATLRFIDRSGPQWLGHAFVGQGLVGIPTETAEAQPLWYPVDALPLDRMWADDHVWLPQILQGSTLEADLLLDGQRLLQHRWRLAQV